MRRREYNRRKWEPHLKLRTSNLTLSIYRSLYETSWELQTKTTIDSHTESNSKHNTKDSPQNHRRRERRKEDQQNKLNNDKNGNKVAVRELLVVQGLRIHRPEQGSGVIPDQGTDPTGHLSLCTTTREASSHNEDSMCQDGDLM